LKGLGVSIITKAEMAKSNKENNKQMTNILGIFSYITMVIGAFGIIGNVSISFIQRKKDIAVISSAGLSKGGRGYMILLESVFQALIGIAIALVAAWGINLCLEDVFKFLTIDLELRYPFESIGTIVIATMMLMLLTSLSTLFKSKKLQIVQELKYE
jgi:putative ABC transport system permease protein